MTSERQKHLWVQLKVLSRQQALIVANDWSAVYSCTADARSKLRHLIFAQRLCAGQRCGNLRVRRRAALPAPPAGR